MMKLLLASLVCLPALALAHPQPPTPPGPPPPGSRPNVCKAEGTVLFEIDDNKLAAIDPAHESVSVTTLYVNGTFTKTVKDGTGKLTSQTGPGCLPDADLRRLTKELDAAAWTIDSSAIHCMAVSNDATLYKMGGKTVFTVRMCSPDKLDAKSQAALDDAVKTLTRVTADPLTSSPGKPVK